MAEDTLSIISFVLAAAGFVIAVAAAVYIKWFYKQPNKTMDVPLGYDEHNKIGIESRKDMMIQSNNQYSSKTSGDTSTSSHFVSYFGVCFQSPENQEKMETRVVEEGLPCKSIEILKHDFHGDKIIMMSSDTRRVESIQTPPTDDENSDDSSSAFASLSLDEKQKQEQNSNSDREINTDDCIESGGISIESKARSKDDSLSFSIYEEDEDDVSFEDSEENSTLQSHERYDEENNVKDPSTPPDRPITSTNDHDGFPMSSTNNEAIEILEKLSRLENSRLEEIEIINRKSDRSIAKNEFIKDVEKSYSYLSSDDEVSTGNSTNSSFDVNEEDEQEIQYTSSALLVQEIDASLTLPNLDESSSNDSVDWELSSSSEDLSEGEETYAESRDDDRVIKRVDTTDDEEFEKEDTDLDECTFCHKVYNKKDGVRFSYDERCKHLMCIACTEEGKFGYLNGECPRCHFQEKPPRGGWGKRNIVESVMSI
mmetsp:Transcript_14691/g.17097  ORF Transcript_14691/g.17097 Transcript_14691/m.17097 type:complete len:482 (+) Transcript_14691:95-1540(+)